MLGKLSKEKTSNVQEDLDNAKLQKIYNQIITDEKFKPDQRGILRKFINEYSVIETQKAYKGFIVQKPKMHDAREE